MDHPLFSQSIDGLWDYDSNEDEGEGKQIHPWLSLEEYLREINHAIDVEINHRDNAISDEIRALYNNKWSIDVDGSNDNNERAEIEEVEQNGHNTIDGKNEEL